MCNYGQFCPPQGSSFLEPCACVLSPRSLQNDSTQYTLKSERCGTTANFSLLRDALFWGTARASYLLLFCKSNQFNLSFKVTQFSKKRRSTHTGWRKKRVPEKVKIGRTYTIFDFLTYRLAVWTAVSLPDANPVL